MGTRIINEFSCILIVFVIFTIMASNSNCEATRHLLQTELVDSASEALTTANVTVLDFGALIGILNVTSGENILYFFLNGTLNDVGRFTGFLLLSRNGTLTGGSLLTVGPLKNFALNGTLGNGTITGSGSGMLVGVGAANGSMTLGTDGTVNLSISVVGPFNLNISGTLTQNGVNGSGSFGAMNLTFNRNGTLLSYGAEVFGVGSSNVALIRNGTLNGSANGTLIGVGTASLTFLPVNVIINPAFL